MQQPTPPVWGPLLLALIAVIACAAYATGSVQITRSEFTWSADRVGEPMPLVLAAQSPETLRAEGPCAAAQSTEVVDLLTTGERGANALTVQGQQGRAWMMYSGQQMGSAIAVDATCTLDVSYDRSSNAATLSAGGQTTQAQLRPVTVDYTTPAYQQFAVTRLGAAPGFEAVVTTQPSSYSSSKWRIVWPMVCAGCLLGIIMLLRRRRDVEVAAVRARRWAATDTLVSGVGVVALVVVPPRFDDGWVLTTVRQYADLGFFSNYYSIDAAAQPQGFWWTWIERLWLVPLGTPGFLLRLPTVLILIGSWWLLRRHVLARMTMSAPAMWLAATVACVGLVGLQITIRPEPLIALLLAAALSVVARYAVTREAWLLAVLGALSALAVAAHQTGWAVVAASLAVLPWAWSWLRERGGWVLVGAVGVCSAALALTLAMLGSNAALWWRSVTAFRRDATTYRSFLDEGDRIAAVATRFDNPAVTVAAVALILLAVLGFLLRARRRDVVEDAVGWAAVSAVGGLFLTTSKLVDHYGAIMPAAAVLGALAVRELTRTAAAGAIVAVIVIAVVGFSGAGVWALGLERASRLELRAWSALALAVVLVAAAVALLGLLRGRQPAGLVAGLIGSLGAVAVALSVLPVVSDGLQNPGSWFGQQLAVGQGNTCGLIDALELREPAISVFERPQTMRGLQPTAMTANPTAWVKGSLFNPITVDITTEDGTQQESLPPSSDVWALVPFPEGSASGAVSSADPAVSVVISSNVATRPASAAVTDSPAAWWVEPGLALQAPCVHSASIRTGAIQAVQHSVGRPGWVGSGLRTQADAVYEVGCVGSPGAGQCLLNLAPVAPAQPPFRELVETVS